MINMKLKLVDVLGEPHEVELGTCELCFSTGEVVEPTFVFEKEDRTQFKVDGYWWNWGDCTEVYVENIVDFASFIAKQTFDENQVFDTNWLFDLIDKYDEID